MKKLFLFICIFLSQSCARDSHPDYVGTIKPKHPSNELWVNGGNEPQTMDPTKCNGDVENNLLQNMFVRLVQTHPVTGEIQPDLAQSWEISEDGTEYTFHLRKDAKWSDGKNVTAHDVEYAWKRLIDPSTGAVAAAMADVIRNAYAFRTGKISKDAVAIRAKDDHTFWVKLETPITYFLGLIDYIVFAPVPQHVIEKLKQEGKEDQWTKVQNMVVNGPFKMTEDYFKQYKVFEKNKSYYHADKVRLTKVKSLIIESSNSDLNSYKTGEHDWSCCISITPEAMEQVQTKKDFHLDPYLSVFFFMANTKKKPLDNVNIRKALSLAIDREMIVKKVLRGGQRPTRNMIPPGILGYQGVDSPLYDPIYAQKLLAKAGYPEGKNFPKLTLKFNTAEIQKLIAEAVQQMWKKNLGIDVELTNVEWSVFLDDQKSGNFEIMRRAWIGDFIDPYTFLSLLVSDGPNNKSGWKNKQYDALLEASNRERDPAKRFAIFQKAEKILLDEQPYMPVYVYTSPYLKKPFLKGFWPNLLDRHPWKYMWIDERWNQSVSNEASISSENPNF